MARTSEPVVAIINASEDVARLLSDAATDEGYRPVVGFVPDFRDGEKDLASFLREHEPTAIVWDIAIPYDVNWRYVQDVRAGGVMRDCPTVLTTTNKRALEQIVGLTEAIEILGRPFDLDEVFRALADAIRRGGDGSGPSSPERPRDRAE